jgi:glycerol-3-phosphate dehydrogenase subunit C
VGRPAARQVAGKGNETLCSDCPLACKHLVQLIADDTAADAPAPPTEAHPIEVFARAYGVF